jgi:hypothetical protein
MTQIARERDCERATDDAVHAITTFVKYAEVDVEAAVRSVQDGHVNSILQDASNTCGWSRVGHAASQVIVRVNDMTPTTPVGRLGTLRSSVRAASPTAVGLWMSSTDALRVTRIRYLS